MKPYAPLGLLYLSSHLRKMGFEVEIYDSTFGSRNELFDILKAGPPAAIGIYANLMTRPAVVDIIGYARNEGWTVILGGPEPSVYAPEYLEAGADIIVAGEGEITLQEVLAALRGSGGGSLHDIAGLVYRGQDHSVVRTAARRLIRDLDSLPWPDRERIDIGRYLTAWRNHHGVGSLSLITARGCPYHCRWCSRSTFGATHRRRHPKNVVDEVEWLVNRYHPDMLWISDDVFTISQDWTLQYAREMKDRGLRVPFECITRADRVSGKVANALAELGCFRLWIGCESGSQRILDAMGRDIELEQVREALRQCKSSGMETGMFLMWGYEGEEVSDIEATIAHVKSARPDIFLTGVSYPIKGTPYFDQVAAQLSKPRSWRDSTDRDHVIRGRRSREFYAVADLLLKSEVALQKMMDKGSIDIKTAAKLRREIDDSRRRLHAGVIAVET